VDTGTGGDRAVYVGSGREFLDPLTLAFLDLVRSPNHPSFTARRIDIAAATRIYRGDRESSATTFILRGTDVP